jgi:hypothetical protein
MVSDWSTVLEVGDRPTPEQRNSPRTDVVDQAQETRGPASEGGLFALAFRDRAVAVAP